MRAGRFRSTLSAIRRSFCFCATRENDAFACFPFHLIVIKATTYLVFVAFFPPLLRSERHSEWRGDTVYTFKRHFDSNRDQLISDECDALQ